MFIIMKHLFYTVLIVPLLLLISISVHAQVSLAPTALFVHDSTNMSELYVTNNSSIPQEINVRFDFQFPASDSTGFIFMTKDSDIEALYSISQSVRVFPRRLVIQPNSSQMLRIQVMPMPDRPDGMYFTRLIVSSSAIAEEVELQQSDEAIGARIDYILEQSIPLFYRKGSNDTGLIIHEVNVDINTERMRLIPHISRIGNSPFLGTITAELYSSDGELLMDTWAPTFLYFSEWRRLDFSLDDLPPGHYRVDIHFDTKRRDMSARDLVQAPRHTHTFEIEL